MAARSGAAGAAHRGDHRLRDGRQPRLFECATTRVRGDIGSRIELEAQPCGRVPVPRLERPARPDRACAFTLYGHDGARRRFRREVRVTPRGRWSRHDRGVGHITCKHVPRAPRPSWTSLAACDGRRSRLEVLARWSASPRNAGALHGPRRRSHAGRSRASSAGLARGTPGRGEHGLATAPTRTRSRPRPKPIDAKGVERAGVRDYGDPRRGASIRVLQKSASKREHACGAGCGRARRRRQ